MGTIKGSILEKEIVNISVNKNKIKIEGLQLGWKAKLLFLFHNKSIPIILNGKVKINFNNK